MKTLTIILLMVTIIAIGGVLYAQTTNTTTASETAKAVMDAAKIKKNATPMETVQAVMDAATGVVHYTKSEVDLRIAMRELWEDHITYTRNYIISTLADLEDADLVAQRLLKNQDEIGEAIKPYYGDDAGKKLADLLKSHILVATEVVKAAKMGNNDELAKAQANWKANADDIAVFLSAANPNWAKKDLTDMLYKHLELTTAEVASRLKKDWAENIDSFDKDHAHMLIFADALTEGIVKQFPDKLKK
ncbi:MAG: glycosyltransferase [Candidatus Omnitrophica bacterium]|nr:glycosyltransferase [Candidatus Omnitrophota bacterium]MDD5236479.1 glycosyltransferase [Candidatus Omnitrophota bacterium]